MKKHKEVEYMDANGRNPFNRVAYKVYGWQVIFTGLFNGRQGARGSTINFEENIIYAISDAEKINPIVHQFYDLQTYKGYTSYKPGDFTFNKLILHWQKGCKKIEWMGWTEGHCQMDILAEWFPYIWGDHPQGIPRNLAVIHGAISPITEETVTLQKRKLIEIPG